MNQERYAIKVDASATTYEFESIGKNGKILKIVQFSPIDEMSLIFNLGFGDLDPSTGVVSDRSVSDNGDTQKILATVAATVLHFTEHQPSVWVFAMGSTPARTRLYRIGITKHLAQIESQFEILGLAREHWQPFERNKDYEAFLVKRKNTL